MFSLRHAIILIVCSLFIPHSSFAADLSVSLPLGPWYRAGKYLPVRVTVQGEKNHIGLAADNISSPGDISQGAGRININLKDGRFDGIVPWFVVDGRAKHPRVFVESPFEFVDGPELKPLGESERLVGWTTPEPAFARELLHNPPKLIPIALDPAKPINGDPAAWELLDAVILDAQSAARLDETQIAGLLAGGVTIAVKTLQPPFANWPWKKQGEYSVLKNDPAGPSGTGATSTGFHEKAFLPIAEWQPGRTWEFRRRVLIVAGGCCVLIIGLALWRPRMTWLWTIALTGAMAIGLGKWWATTAAVQQATGQIIVLNASGLTQTDSWLYQTSSSLRSSTVPWRDVTRPIFASRSGADDIPIALAIDSSGRPIEFQIEIPSHRKVALLSRTVGPHSPKTPPDPHLSSPLSAFADETYLSDGGKSLGQLPITNESQIQQWNAVVIDRRSK